MTTAALCMLISHPKWSFVKTSLQAILATRNFDEILLGISPIFQHLDKLQEFLEDHKNVEYLPGARSRKQILTARKKLFSKAQSEWLVVVDDDDIALSPLPLDEISPKVGMIHSDILAFCTTDVSHGLYQTGDFFIRRSNFIANPADSSLFRGSYYAFRKKAWEQARKYLLPKDESYDEWRVAWVIRRLGWDDLYIPNVLQLQRVRDYSSESDEWYASGQPVWDEVVVEMESRFAEINPQNINDAMPHHLRRIDAELSDQDNGYFTKVRLDYSGNWGKAALLSHLFPSIPLRESILDMGCGVGSWIVQLWDRGFHNLTGTDIKERHITTASKLCKIMGVRADFKQTPLFDALTTEQYYVITAMGVVFDACPTPQSFIQAAHKHVKPGGFLAFEWYLDEKPRKKSRSYWSVDEIEKASKKQWDVHLVMTRRYGRIVVGLCVLRRK